MQRSEKSKMERRCLPEFFKRHIENVTACENCGLLIRGPSSMHIAHILPKEVFKSVMCNDDNVMYLCSSLDRQDNIDGCHNIFDNEVHDKVKHHKMWEVAKERFKKFEHLIKERSTELLKFM